ncbi:translation elongation factor Ts [Spiribacter vilamensis]|uniref:Elongation factor Ts n=1 Tax=Spiribacter vilamensis TaxID=531306 RepID=A0A4Q8CZS3_9GAMM|nr:translation elongation factor Ts [Spiribacter vilamensis]RZU98447.1 translation elongation factor Ts (EF-Ts) [Spiribacter vilamensis]TVO60679.1 elongation factor Ts [Spiribacter vilamensis]
MAISAQQVKDLRERTGAGMMECKKALVETDGDMESAVEHMRKRGLAKADKKAGRVAADGAVIAKVADDGRSGAIVEINSETDFVANGDDFQAFAGKVMERILNDDPADLEALLALPLETGGDSVELAQKELIAKIGENIQIRRFQRYGSESGQVQYYLHGSRIGVLVEIEGGDEALGRDLCMHIAASRPVCVGVDDVPEERAASEREVLVAQAQASGKPPEIIDKMVEGRLRKWLAEITLLGQPFVKDPDQTVEDLLKARGARVIDFTRLEVGEGIEKKEENFAEEVAATIQGS